MIKVYNAEKAAFKRGHNAILGSPEQFKLEQLDLKSVSSVAKSSSASNNQLIKIDNRGNQDYTEVSADSGQDVFRTASEAVADLEIMSHCEAIVGSGTSHFTTTAFFLSWYQQYYGPNSQYMALCKEDQESSETCKDFTTPPARTTIKDIWANKKLMGYKVKI